MSGLIYLLGAVVLSAVGLGILWFVERAPLRDSLKGVDDFERARMALKRRDRPHLWRDGAGQQAGSVKGNRDRQDSVSSAVKILR